MKATSEERDLLALLTVPGIGPRLVAALLERFGSAAGVRDASLASLSEVPHLAQNVTRKVQESLRRNDVEEELALLEQHEVRLIALGHADYPAPLANTVRPPPLLFVRGKLTPEDAQGVAVVGSRACTSYGIRIAERLGFDLARAGVTVVSGLAHGIDAAAHRGAFSAKGRTIAVLAGGLSKIYPPEHTDLAKEIVAAGGALISESALRMEPMGAMFPARNRIISGLSRGVVLVEAAEKSGALITARHAGEQGREVFAVPGPVDHPASAGTLHLLRQGAKLVRHARDVLDDLAGIAPLTTPQRLFEEGPRPPQAPPPNLEPVQLAIWEVLDEAHSIDEMCRHVEKPIAELASVLMTMELKRIVRRLPGNMYERAQ